MAPNLNQILMQVWCQYRIKQNNAEEIAPFYGAIWDEFSEQR